MIVRIESGIQGLDQLMADDKSGLGGFPENTATLVYGPPKVGKSIFCYQFMHSGLLLEEPCLYILTDYGIKQLQQNTSDFGWYLDDYIENDLLYIVDAISSISGTKIVNTKNYAATSVHNPTDIMVKLGVGTRYISNKSPRFRSILDSLTTLFAFNQELLIVRVLTAYIMRIREAGGTAIITYTEGSADIKVETMLKAVVDNVIKLDGEYITIEAMVGCGTKKAPYKITADGIIIE
ncbi:MAG: RAD55 family ATPase [Methanomicrobiales archaeon]